MNPWSLSIRDPNPILSLIQIRPCLYGTAAKKHKFYLLIVLDYLNVNQTSAYLQSILSKQYRKYYCRIVPNSSRRTRYVSLLLTTFLPRWVSACVPQIVGNKKDNLTIIYTPGWVGFFKVLAAADSSSCASRVNLLKRGDMAVGQVSFHSDKKVRRVHVVERVNAIINRLNKVRWVYLLCAISFSPLHGRLTFELLGLSINRQSKR